MLCDVEEQQATDTDGEMVKGGRGFNEAFDVDGEEITKETIGDVVEEVAEEMVECEVEGVVGAVTDEISEYDKIRAANVKQREKLLKQLKRDWQGYKKGEGFVTG